jgi:hypothetical protein
MDDTTPRPKTAPMPVRGQLHRFLPLPIIPHHAKWFEAGPVTFALEVRVIQERDKATTDRSESVHVFNADRSEEYARFDSFGAFPHYHYILNGPQHNIVWGYDDAIHGPMLPWALATIRDRLPSILRAAQANALADLVERDGFDVAVLDRIAESAQEWQPRPSPEILEETRAWGVRWKQLHPQFNTAE